MISERELDFQAALCEELKKRGLKDFEVNMKSYVDVSTLMPEGDPEFVTNNMKNIYAAERAVMSRFPDIVADFHVRCKES